MAGLLEIAAGFPNRTFAAGDVLLTDGTTVDELYVLVRGTLRVEKAGVTVTTLGTPGACVGEMSLLLGVPVTADVVAVTESEVAVIDDAPAMLEAGGLTLELARMLAGRLQVMTTYLVDLKQQYADHEGGLGMVDVVLGTLMQGGGPKKELRSARDPDPEY
ncbi:MAG: cyclic nucleotide-binding domain-containing protein [Acidimicrobiia bacterium]